LLRPLAPIFGEITILSVFINLLALAGPVFVLQVYDRVVFHAGVSTLYALVIGMAFAILFDYVLRQARARILQRVALRVDVTLGRHLFDKILSLPLAALESQPAAHWQSLFRDAGVVRNTLSGATAVLVCDLPFAVLFVALTCLIATPVAWVLALTLPLFFLVAWRSAAALTHSTETEREAALGRDTLIAEILAGRTTVKALSLDRAMRPLWEERTAAAIERALVRGVQSDGYANIATTLTLATSVAMTAVGAMAIIDQRLTIGALIAANMLSGRLFGPLNQLVGNWRSYAAFRQAVNRLDRLFASRSDRETSAVRLPRPKGKITLEDVSFAYPATTRPALDRLDLTLQPGLSALVGANGSGKSTLLKLIQGLYPPNSGRVLIDGADVGQFTRAEIADWIGYLPQDCVLFAGSLRDNIAFRASGASDDAIIRAAQTAGVHDVIVDLPDGYDSAVGEAGRRLSAGQRQRIAIARALVGDPPMLLLDEPSSNLDREAEIALRNTLAELALVRTVIVVSHSPILLTACQNVVVLDCGRVAHAGTAEEVLPRIGFALRATPRPALAAADEKAEGHATRRAH
jgi:PrtD family type I secretion system ABC transporter